MPIIATIAGNKVYVCDSENHRISIFTKEGEFVTSFGSQGHEQGQFNYPVHLHITEDGDMLISDYLNNRIQVF